MDEATVEAVEGLGHPEFFMGGSLEAVDVTHVDEQEAAEGLYYRQSGTRNR